MERSKGLNSPEWLGKSDMIKVCSQLPKGSQFPDVSVAFDDFNQ